MQLFQNSMNSIPECAFWKKKFQSLFSHFFYMNRVPNTLFSVKIPNLTLQIISNTLFLMPGPLLDAKYNLFWPAHILARKFLYSLVQTWLNKRVKVVLCVFNVSL